MKDYYGILGVSPMADAREIKAAYRKLAKQYHPDVIGDDPGKRQTMYEIQEAYAVIGDVEKRREHDRKCNQKQAEKTQGKQENRKERHFSREEEFQRFFGFQPGKGMDTYKGKGQGKTDAGSVKPEEMFASFFKNIKW